jgi:sarcosine oxidase subunit beta
MKTSSDVVIIGGGISGCSIAYNLAKKGVKNIVVVEKNYLASGATGRCGAGVRQQWGAEMNCRIAQKSIQYFETAKEELGYDRDIEFKQGGYLIVSTNELENEQFRANVELQNSLDIPSKYLTPEEARYIVPYLNTDIIKGATFCPTDGHLNPFLVTDAYYKAAKRLGVTFMTHTEVIGIETFNKTIRGVVTDKGHISTRIVVNVAGGYSREICKMAGMDLPVFSERHEILVTEPIDPMLDPMVMSFSLNIYCQQTPHGSFIMGRGDDSETSCSTNSTWQFLSKMSKTVTSLLPPIGELRVVRQWAGLYNNTADHQPILGASGLVDGLYIAAGFSGHGFMFGPMTGLLLAETILGEETTIDISPLSIDRFKQGTLVYEKSVV